MDTGVIEARQIPIRIEGNGEKSSTLWFYYVLFFFSGFPALSYQIVWQRALFTIYGVNIESVTVIVTAFMLGLGLGSLAGGRLSKRPLPLLAIFGAIELGLAPLLVPVSYGTLLTVCVGSAFQECRQYFEGVPGMARGNWKIETVTEVSRALDELAGPGEPVISSWSGYIFQSRAALFVASRTTAGWPAQQEVREKLTPAGYRVARVIGGTGIYTLPVSGSGAVPYGPAAGVVYALTRSAVP